MESFTACLNCDSKGINGKMASLIFKVTLGEIFACTFCFPLLSSYSLLNPQRSNFHSFEFIQKALFKFTSGLHVV